MNYNQTSPYGGRTRDNGIPIWMFVLAALGFLSSLIIFVKEIL